MDVKVIQRGTRINNPQLECKNLVKTLQSKYIEINMITVTKRTMPTETKIRRFINKK